MSTEPLEAGIFLDVRIGILCGDLPKDFVLKPEAMDDPISPVTIRCYSTDLNAALHAAEKLGITAEAIEALRRDYATYHDIRNPGPYRFNAQIVCAAILEHCKL